MLKEKYAALHPTHSVEFEMLTDSHAIVEQWESKVTVILTEDGEDLIEVSEENGHLLAISVNKDFIYRRMNNI